MKRVINSSNNIEDFDDMSFVFDITDEFIESYIVPKVKSKITERFGKRFKTISIDSDNVRFNKSKVLIEFDVYNNNQHKTGGEFSFTRYNSYFDESDFYQHLNTSISEFVSYL